MKKIHKNIIAIFITAVILYGIYYVMITVPTRHDRTLISDLSKTKKILITLSRYDLICFSIKANEGLKFKKLELIIKNPDGGIVLSTSKYVINDYSNTVIFSPRFYSVAEAYPPVYGSSVMAVFLKPEVPFELEIKYQENDNKKVFQRASLEMVASSKGKYGYSDKHFSVKPINSDK